MLKTENFKKLILSLIIFSLPFLEFLKNNINEIDIIIGVSFYCFNNNTNFSIIIFCLFIEIFF